MLALLSVGHAHVRHAVQHARRERADAFAAPVAMVVRAHDEVTILDEACDERGVRPRPLSTTVSRRIERTRRSRTARHWAFADVDAPHVVGDEVPRRVGSREPILEAAAQEVEKGVGGVGRVPAGDDCEIERVSLLLCITCRLEGEGARTELVEVWLRVDRESVAVARLAQRRRALGPVVAGISGETNRSCAREQVAGPRRHVERSERERREEAGLEGGYERTRRACAEFPAWMLKIRERSAGMQERTLHRLPETERACKPTGARTGENGASGRRTSRELERPAGEGRRAAAIEQKRRAEGSAECEVQRRSNSCAVTEQEEGEGEEAALCAVLRPPAPRGH